MDGDHNENFEQDTTTAGISGDESSMEWDEKSIDTKKWADNNLENKFSSGETNGDDASTGGGKPSWATNRSTKGAEKREKNISKNSNHPHDSNLVENIEEIVVIDMRESDEKIQVESHP